VWSSFGNKSDLLISDIKKAKTMSNKDRKTGWYYVRLVKGTKSKWQCAFWDHCTQYWDAPTFVCNIINHPERYDDELEVGDAVLMPKN
jgi:hypothetical protein